MTLLELLRYRFEVAKSFTKEFHEEVEKAVMDYECEPSEKEKLARLSNLNDRYQFTIPYIFATHESMFSNLFDKVPEIIFTGKGKLDAEKAKKVEAIYNYLIDTCDLEGFMQSSGWWFLLTGFLKSSVYFKSEYQEVPMIDEMTGEPMTDEVTGEPLTRVEYTFNDPVVELADPKKIFFSPESKFTEDGKQVPYLFEELLMTLDDVKATYGKKVKADAQLDIKSDKDNSKGADKDDIQRVKVYKYYGTLPNTPEIKKDVKDYEYGRIYYIVSTKDKILYTEGKERSSCQLGKYYGAPNKFFGFGIGKTLRPFQKELSIRRGQQLRYADVAAFPKIGIEETSPIDEKALNDPRANVVLLYKDKPPVYLTAPDMSNTLILSEQKAREDAQFVSGMLDLSKGGQDSNIVKTATGQAAFFETADKRSKKAKRQYSKFYKAVIVELLQQCKENWDEEKVLSITDEKGNDVEIQVTGSDLADIDFLRDIDFEFETTSLNKDVLRAQSIELYNSFKEDPNVDQDKLREFVLREGFGQKNPEIFALSDEEKAMQQMQDQGMNTQAQDPNMLQNGQMGI